MKPMDRAIRTVSSIALIVLIAGPAVALEMTSASYSSRGGNPNGGGSVDLTSTAPSPAFSGGAGTLGQREAVGLSGSASDLTTSRPGFWAIVQRELASLDADGDGIQSFLDADDDNDGLPDAVETRTGTFNSPSDTGSDPNDPDTDGDGDLDGAEVLAGTDPNVASASVPALSATGTGLAVALMTIVAAGRLRRKQVLRHPWKSK